MTTLPVTFSVQYDQSFEGSRVDLEISTQTNETTVPPMWIISDEPILGETNPILLPNSSNATARITLRKPGCCALIEEFVLGAHTGETGPFSTTQPTTLSFTHPSRALKFVKISMKLAPPAEQYDLRSPLSSFGLPLVRAQTLQEGNGPLRRRTGGADSFPNVRPNTQPPANPYLDAIERINVADISSNVGSNTRCLDAIERIDVAALLRANNPSYHTTPTFLRDPLEAYVVNGDDQ